ncbi:thioredoxin reductase (NADPH) [Novosphingobium sp. PhB165]|uniref:NAD(P)/FAD-dependent oxidoreductase n=1 Tax=Novosphingobium sp. PhB165 TaxID=2485105 RepID=UPI0010494350|nr:NAD(P)/FAD-dependent oxidoreductase [Novosphingobium sp. PhB165]TCM14363.1 thioredoxin reductase (NADPH) [Novosphingobium sp. PhB165]
MAPLLDCLIVGGGPAGLTAAIYLARFHLALRIVDAGDSRAALIPLTRNHAGYPGGISGRELLRRMREQAAEFGAEVISGTIERIEWQGSAFSADLGGRALQARTILLATGVVNNRPDLAPSLHDHALARGLIRYCPICDGYEVTDKNVGVLGTHSHGCNEAIFLRMFTKNVTLIAPDSLHDLSPTERERLGGLNVRIVDGPCATLRVEHDAIVVPTPAGNIPFDTLYPALGSRIRSELAIALGARVSPDGCLLVDPHQRTSIPGLYAAGDVSKGLDQISHAMGEAGVAATTIRNDLAENGPLAR